MWNKLIFPLITSLLIFKSISFGLPIKNDDSFAEQSIENVAESIPSSSVEHQPPRRLITYDQRQDGKYNIRADLENFVILVVPSNPSNGVALLDMLTRPNLKNVHGITSGGNKGKKFKKEKISVSNSKEQAISTGKNSASSEQQHEQQINVNVDRFIEGRTPYHVDISGLGTETSAISILPSSQQISINNKLNNDQQELLQRSAPFVFPLRNSRAIIDSRSTDLRTNSVVGILSKSLKSTTTKKTANSVDHNHGYINDDGDNDVDHTDPENSYDSIVQNTATAVDSIDELAAIDQRNGSNDNNDGWELTLLGALEQCGPDRRRDSYGICQFVPQDF